MADVSSRADQADDTPSGGLTLLVDGPYRDVLWPRDPPDVLVVDDQRKFADIVARSLERAGCATEVCTSLREMFTQIEHAPPDLLVLDRWLLDGDGVEACEALRCRGVAGGIIVMTGDAAAGGDARLAGADDFILKPFAVKELVTRAVALTRRVTGSVTERGEGDRSKRQIDEDYE
ncbi:MAG: response regulator transcription factor [Polyangiaceae bacterium]|nr:response regulator transcription factor [Polyangiaceae bacterium]MCL4754585.1 response regulator [Myxococcales bacterium]